MLGDEDLPHLLSTDDDVCVAVVIGGQAGSGLLRKEVDEVLMHEGHRGVKALRISVLIATAAFPTVGIGTAVTADGEPYSVRDMGLQGLGGQLSRLDLKVAAPAP